MTQVLKVLGIVGTKPKKKRVTSHVVAPVDMFQLNSYPEATADEKTEARERLAAWALTQDDPRAALAFMLAALGLDGER
jgi:hypothetical protein